MTEIIKLLASAFRGAASLLPIFMLASLVLVLFDSGWGVDPFGLSSW